jgi:hypothetical protein
MPVVLDRCDRDPSIGRTIGRDFQYFDGGARVAHSRA